MQPGSSLVALQWQLLVSGELTVTSRTIFLFEPPRLGPGSPALVCSAPHSLVHTFFRHLRETESFSFFPWKFRLELQLHVSYPSQRLVGGRQEVREEEDLRSCRLFSAFVSSQYYRKREEKELPSHPARPPASCTRRHERKLCKPCRSLSESNVHSL